MKPFTIAKQATHPVRLRLLTGRARQEQFLATEKAMSKN
jgi:hypothetical protein